MLICMCVYIKINGVTSTCTQNKSHTTHLQIPSLSSVSKKIYNQHNTIIFIVHIAHIYVFVYHINNINYINKIVRGKSYWTWPYSDQYLYYLVILTNL